MAKFIALEDIGDFKKGQEVPADKALAWKAMYKVSPVREVEDVPKAKELPLETLEAHTPEPKPHKKVWGSRK